MFEQPKPNHGNAQSGVAENADISDLLAQLAVQLENVRHILCGTRTNEHVAATSPVADVVFVDDLAHCMECSWAKLEAAGLRLAPDVIAQCGRLLEASLHVLQQVERMQANAASRPRAT